MSETPENTNIVDSIMDLKRRDPFQKFKIVLASGSSYEIETGENLVELRSEFFYATPGGERFTFIRKSQIAAVEGSERSPRSKTKRKAS